MQADSKPESRLLGVFGASASTLQKQTRVAASAKDAPQRLVVLRQLLRKVEVIISVQAVAAAPRCCPERTA